MVGNAYHHTVEEREFFRDGPRRSSSGGMNLKKPIESTTALLYVDNTNSLSRFLRPWRSAMIY